jgi:Asp-tRNA(Asn)/Glu-tRNA(Gln) amidotransferase A subunit family amidase
MIEAILAQWRRLELDLVLCPTFPFPAIPHNIPGKQQAACLYTIMWNLFDFPSGVVPFGQESGEKIDSYDTCGDFVLRLAKKAVKNNSRNMPISVQIVGLPYEEEKVLRGMQILESLSPMPAKYWSAKRPMEKVYNGPPSIEEEEDE